MKLVEPRPIKEFALGIYDGPHATPKESSEGAVFLGIKNITEDGRLDMSEIRYVSEQELPRWTRRVTPQGGDLVLTYEATLHHYAIIPDGFRGCLGRRVALIRPDPKKADSRFMLYYFLSRKWREVVERFVKSGATVDRVPLEKLPDFQVRFPRLSVQKEIADLLSDYDELIGNNRRRMELLEESARLLYREWFVRLRFPGHEHARLTHGIPQGWEKKSLESVCSEGDGIQTGPFGSQLHQSDYTEEGVPVVMPTNIIGFRISTEGIARIPEELADKLGRHRMIPGDTVYGRRGDIGRRAFISGRLAGWFCGTGCLRIRPDPKVINPRYLFDTLGSPDTAGTISNRAKGATMPNLNGGVLKSVPVLVAPRSLQNIYAEQVEPMAEMIETLEVQNQKLRAARDLLLPRLMSGEVAV